MHGPLLLDPLPLISQHREGIIFTSADHLSSQLTQVVLPLIVELGLRMSGQFDCLWILTNLTELLHSPFWRTHLNNDDAKFPVPQDPIDTSSPTEPVHLELRMPESTNPIRVQSPQFAGRLKRETKEEHVGTGICVHTKNYREEHT